MVEYDFALLSVKSAQCACLHAFLLGYVILTDADVVQLRCGVTTAY